jgi:hypothetical protein
MWLSHMENSLFLIYKVVVQIRNTIADLYQKLYDDHEISQTAFGQTERFS